MANVVRTKTSFFLTKERIPGTVHHWGEESTKTLAVCTSRDLCLNPGLKAVQSFPRQTAEGHSKEREFRDRCKQKH